MDVARQKGKLADGVTADEACSSLERGRLKLRDHRANLIVVIPVQEARDMLAYRRELGRKVMEGVGMHVNDMNPASIERWKVRVQTPEVRALTWAISTGRRIPYRRRLRGTRLITVILLLCGLIPGLIFLAWNRRRNTAYQNDLAALVKRWRSAGQPEPLASFFLLHGY